MSLGKVNRVGDRDSERAKDRERGSVGAGEKGDGGPYSRGTGPTRV